MTEKPNDLTRKVFLAEMAAVNEHIDATHQPAAPDDRGLRDRYAQALVRYDWNAGLSGRDTPSEHHYGEADAVLAVRDRELERMKVLVAASESPGHAVRLAAQYADRAIENGERADAVELQVKQARALEAKWTQIAADNEGAVVSVGVAAGILKATLDGFNDLLAEVEGR